MGFMLPLNAVNNQEAAGRTLQRPHIQQLLKKGPGGAHGCKEGWPHLGVCFARHAHYYVSKDWEMAYELRCSLQQWTCRGESERLESVSDMWCVCRRACSATLCCLIYVLTYKLVYDGCTGGK